MFQYPIIFTIVQLGSLAILFRQTNVVWMMFVAADGAMNYIEDFNRSDGVQKDQRPFVEESDAVTNNRSGTGTSTMRRRRIKGSSKDASLSNSETDNNVTYQTQGSSFFFLLPQTYVCFYSLHLYVFHVFQRLKHSLFICCNSFTLRRNINLLWQNNKCLISLAT